MKEKLKMHTTLLELSTVQIRFEKKKRYTHEKWWHRGHDLYLKNCFS
uniref:Uncharacterized protein n=1 Tax=Anguilla anguilla TaxID=7936 RepID=A0A0E9U7C1_ANGAN